MAHYVLWCCDLVCVCASYVCGVFLSMRALWFYLCASISVQSLDLTKANWTLRVVTDKSEAESISMTKDTERMDQIKAIKEAWEAAEPGRGAKVTRRL